MADRTPDENNQAQDVSNVGRDELGAQIRANAAAWRSLLKRGDLVVQRPPAVGARPSLSALERGCAVRDVDAQMAKQLKTALSKKSPTLPGWDREQAAAKGRYPEQGPTQLAYDLARHAGKVADIVDRISGDQWDRSGLRSTGGGFTVEGLVRDLLTDVVHQAQAAQEGYQTLTADGDDEGGDVDA